MLSCHSDGIRLTVRAKPNCSRPLPLRIVDIGDGKCALEVAINAPAQDGKANKAIINRLADLLDLRKADIRIATGSSGKIKVIEVAGDPDRLQQQILMLCNAAT